MATDFDTEFGSGDFIEVHHVKQYAAPIIALENAMDDKQDEAPALNQIAALNMAKGDILVHDGASIIKMGPGSNGQVLSANSSTGSGLAWVAQSTGGGGGATELSDLSDATVSSPVEGQVLRYNAATLKFLNSQLGIADVSNLQSELAAKASSTHVHDAGDITTGNLSIARGGTGAGTAADARNNLGAQAQNASLDQIASLSLTKGDIFVHNGTSVTRLAPGSSDDGDVLALASGSPTGLAWITPSAGGGGGASELDDLNDVEIITPAEGQVLRYNAATLRFVNSAMSVSDVNGLQGELADKANVSHTHAASDITSGTLAVAQGGTGAGSANAARTSLDVPSNADLSSGLSGKANASHTHAASDITSGTLAVAQGGTGAGSASAARASLDVPSNADLSSGLSGKANASHTHAASDITSGTLAVAQGGTGAGSAGAARTSLDVPSNADLSSGLSGKANASHTHSAADITSGTIPVARGGTGANTAAAALSSLGAQPQDAALDEISTLTMAKGDIFVHNGSEVTKLGPGADGQVLAADSNTGSGLAWVAQSGGGLTSPVGVADGGTGATTAAAARGNLDVPSNADLSTGLAGKANSSHTHAATDIGSGTVSNAEFGYLDGVTSPIQTQLNSKLSGTVPIASGGTGATTAASARSNLDVPSNSALTSGLAGKANVSHSHSASSIGSGSVNDTEFGYLDGVTSSIQNQLNNKMSALTGGSAGKVAFWSGSSSLTNYSTIDTASVTDMGIARQYLYAGGFSSDGGFYRSSTGRTYMPNIRNFGAGQLMYFVNTSGTNVDFGEVVYQFSRGAHKEDVKSLELSMDELMLWRPVEFKWKERFGGSPDVGFIAEEVEALYPLAATYDKAWEYTDEATGDYAVEEDGFTPKRVGDEQVVSGVKYEKAWIPMLAGVQDFYKRFQALAERVAVLESLLQEAE